MSEYKIAGIDVHKKMLAVVVANVAGEGNYVFERQSFGTAAEQLRKMAVWLAEREVKEAVMESTAQYWKPVWRELEGECRLHLAQAFSNRTARGRKEDFRDAERLVRRHVAGELILSFVPDPEQQLWRTVTHTKLQLTRDRVRLANQLESLLEDCRIKLSSLVSQLLGASSRRMLLALAKGETDPAALAALAAGLKADKQKLCDALSGAATLDSFRRSMLRMTLDRLSLIENQIAELDVLMAELLRKHSDAVSRLAEIPGMGIDSAQQIIAEVGPEASAFASSGKMASWVGVCPGREESAAVSKSDRSPKGNRAMRRVLNQCANAAVKAKGSAFEVFYRRIVPRLGHKKAIWAVAHRLCRVAWQVLHGKVRYREFGPRPNTDAVRNRASRLASQLRKLGYSVTPPPPQVLA